MSHPASQDGAAATRSTGRGDGMVPSRRQYLALKAQHPEAILLYRLGDFYETFDDDAHLLARDARVVLTSRSFGRSGRSPMAGIPHHALNHYLGRLLAAGHTVAIAEQMTPPGKGLVERAVTRVLTPGTISDPALLPSGENRYLAAVQQRGERWGKLIVTIGQQQQYGMGGDIACQGEEQIQAGFVAPVQVFDDQDERLAGGEAGEELHQGLDTAALLLLRIGWKVGKGTGEMCSQLRQQPDELCGLVCQHIRDLVRCAPSQPAPQQVKQGCVGQHSVWLEATPLQDCQTLARGSGLELGNQAGLANAGLPSNQRGLALSDTRLVDKT